jgi:hypothetical protein
MMLGIPLGLLAFNAGEWLTHKVVLHERGKKGGYYAFHFHEHHKETRKHDGEDAHYRRSMWGWHSQSKEALALLGVGVLHAPLLPVAPFFTATVWVCLANYFRVHRKAHLDPAWARRALPWHWDHHMGPDQDQNWCVTNPLFDWIMGTRMPYLGTQREARDRQRRAERAQRAAITPDRQSDSRTAARATR